MLALADAILEDIQTAVDPTPADLYRDEEVTLPYVWVRPPSDNRGPYAALRALKGALMYIDLWHYAWAGVNALEANLAFLDGHVVTSEGDAYGLRYSLESVTRVQEPDSCHASLLYSVQYVDSRVIA